MMVPSREYFLFLLIFASVFSTTALQPSSGLLPWYALEGLSFECTGCSKCCKVKGSVTATEAEVRGMARELKMPFERFCEEHVERSDYAAGLFSLRSRRGFDGSEACTLLGLDGRCTAYAERPLQCRTYPFWPELMESREAWEREAVAPDEGFVDAKGGRRGGGQGRIGSISTSGGSSSSSSSSSGGGGSGGGGSSSISSRRKWDPAKGGCEGINNPTLKGWVPGPVATVQMLRQQAEDGKLQKKKKEREKKKKNKGGA